MEDQYLGTAFSGKNRLRNETNFTPFGNGKERGPGLTVDLNEELVGNPSATYYLRMKGDAMKDAGIFDNDILVVDRSIKNANGKVIIATLNGEMLVRRFHKNFSSAFLIPENDRYKTINLAEFGEFSIWGVVIHSIHSHG